MKEKRRRIAIMLDLREAYARHTDVFAGTQRFATECGTWDCVIDEIADHRLPADGKGPIPYDGVIARATEQLAQRTKRCGIPLVNVWVSSPAEDVPYVSPDMKAAGGIAAQHLIDRGLRSFACMGPFPGKPYELNKEGFVGCLEEAGFEHVVTPAFEDARPETPQQWLALEETMAECIDGWETPIGVFVLVESYLRILVQMCIQRGLRIPEDVAIILNQNEPHYCDHPLPSISSLDLGYERVGYEAAVLLERMMDGGPAPDEPILIPPQGLIVRQSTDFFAVDDEQVAQALQFIASNIQNQISVSDVAEAVLTSLSTLQNRFREHLGRSISAEIRRLRIERAKRHLTDSKDRIAEIAQKAGFGSQHLMNEVFRRELGVTPSEYRKKHAR